MLQDKNNVILLPNVQKELQTEAFGALQDKKFDRGLEKLNELLRCSVSSYEVNIGKLICLINLREFNDALEFAELILDKDDQHYVDYFDYYLMILYEMELYHEVISEITWVRSMHDIPEGYIEKLSMMFELAMQMNQEAFQLLFKKFNLAVVHKNHLLQWNYLHQLKKLNIQPPQSIKELLVEETIHPVIKTYIIDWFQNSGEKGEVNIEKFNQKTKIDLYTYPSWIAHPKYDAIRHAISEIEHKDPTLYEIVDSLLKSYIYVNYPMIEKGNVEDLAAALIYLGKSHLSITEDILDKSLLEYIEMISFSHELYLSIVSD